MNIADNWMWVNKTLDLYIGYSQCFEYKHRRRPNFPEISEDIVLHILKHHCKRDDAEHSQTGDLKCVDGLIEVKSFSSSGPISFGPTEKWTELIILDCLNYRKKLFKCYSIKLIFDGHIDTIKSPGT